MMQLFESDSSSASCSSQNCSDVEMEEPPVNPAQLLSLAIKKRRSVYNRKERDFRQELLHTGLIQSLCKFLGEGRAKRRRRRRSKHTAAAAPSSTSAGSTSSVSSSACDSGIGKPHRRSADRKREWSDNAELANCLWGGPVELTGSPSAVSTHIVSLDEASSGGGGVIQPIVQRCVSTSCDAAPAADEQQCDLYEQPPCKVSRVATCDDADPFGLDALFREYFGRSISAGCKMSSSTGEERSLGASFSCHPSIVPPVARRDRQNWFAVYIGLRRIS